MLELTTVVSFQSQSLYFPPREAFGEHTGARCCHRTCQNLLRNEFWQLKCDFAFKIGLLEPEEYISIILMFFFCLWWIPNGLLLPNHFMELLFLLIRSSSILTSCWGPGVLPHVRRSPFPHLAALKPCGSRCRFLSQAAFCAFLYLDTQLACTGKELSQVLQDFVLQRAP